METKRIDLPMGWSAMIRTREWLTERQAREVSRSLVDTIGVGTKLSKAGFDDSDPSTYEAYTVLSPAERETMNSFETTLVTQFLVKLLVDGEPAAYESPEDLPQVVFEALSVACLAEWTPKDTDLADPKADTDDSPS